MKFGFWSGVSFHPDLNLMVWQPRGILDEPHVEQLISLLEHTEDEAERPFNRYTDLSRLDAVELTFNMSFRCRFIADWSTASVQSSSLPSTPSIAQPRGLPLPMPPSPPIRLYSKGLPA